MEEQDPRVTEANGIIDSYFSATYKPTSEVIKKNRQFFDTLCGVNEIYVLGHSVSEVDIPYFEEVFISTNKSQPKWTVTYFSAAKIPYFTKALVGLGVPKANLQCIRMTSL